jgi:hypothetical protein
MRPGPDAIRTATCQKLLDPGKARAADFARLETLPARGKPPWRAHEKFFSRPDKYFPELFTFLGRDLLR